MRSVGRESNMQLEAESVFVYVEIELRALAPVFYLPLAAFPEAYRVFLTVSPHIL